MPDNQRGELDNFKNAIKNDYLQKVTLLRSETENQLADIVISRRMKVEKLVEEIRSGHRSRFQSRLHRQELHVQQQLRNCLMEIHSEMISIIESNVKEKILNLREDKAKYSGVMKELVNEGLELIGKPSVIYTLKNDALLVPERDDIQGVNESIDDIWGGCLIVEYGSGRMIVDNTLKTRWLRLFPQLSERLTYEIDKLLGPIVQEFARKLRIS